MRDVSKELQKIEPEALRKDFATIVAGLARGRRHGAGGGAGRRRGAGGAAPAGGKTPEPRSVHRQPDRERQPARSIPVLGRDFEIRQMIDILTRRRQNNPILTGEAGVGKTAVVEGFALRIAQGDVPPPLQQRHRPHARPGAAAGRRRRQGRVREPAQGPDRRGEVLAHADHPVHRRSPHHDRRRRRRPARTTRPTC